MRRHAKLHGYLSNRGFASSWSKMLSMVSVACWFVLEQCLKVQVQLNDEGSLAGLPVVLNARVRSLLFPHLVCSRSSTLLDSWCNQ